ncbi:MAG: CinA family nicotinamide mononucleotide deamidase-related protein [Fidelibacterota bacterium]
MNIALITIGNELLAGFTVDTNASWIGRELSKAGGRLTWHQTIGDERKDILQALATIPTDCEIGIITGGLGPTHDDITADTLYEFSGDTPVFDQKYWNDIKYRLSLRNIDIPELNKNQAMRPQKGESIDNPIGSARGLHFVVNEKHLFALPGVPREMRTMMKSSILPFIRENSNKELFVRTVRTTGIMESALAEKLSEILNSIPHSIRIAFLPQFIGVDVRMSGYNEKDVNKLTKRIQLCAGKYIYGFDDEKLEETVGNMLEEKKLTIATAESCTGGLIGHRITGVSGSSSYYVGGIISYSNDVKEQTLNVDHSTLEKFGAVSGETAIQMAENVRQVLKSNLGLSVTGIAGPTGGTKEKPVGLVYIALADGSHTQVKEFHFINDRGLNKHASSQAALNMVRLYLMSR